MFNRSKKDMSHFDWILFLVTLILCVFGFIVVFSATVSRGGQWHALKSQFAATALGVALIVLLQYIDVDYMKKLAMPIYGIAVLLLIATMLFGVGEDAWGARSWLKLGPVTFQPAEFTKIAVMIAFAMLLALGLHRCCFGLSSGGYTDRVSASVTDATRSHFELS